MNVADILIISIVTVLAAAAVICVFIGKRRGKGTCSCGCENCSRPCAKKTGL